MTSIWSLFNIRSAQFLWKGILYLLGEMFKEGYWLESWFKGNTTAPLQKDLKAKHWYLPIQEEKPIRLPISYLERESMLQLIMQVFHISKRKRLKRTFPKERLQPLLQQQLLQQVWISLLHRLYLNHCLWVTNGFPLMNFHKCWEGQEGQHIMIEGWFTLFLKLEVNSTTKVKRQLHLTFLKVMWKTFL